jgi:hypothetical protein
MNKRTTNAIAFEESVVLDSAMLKDADFKLHETKDGYMVCMPRVARTGIQEYLGVEMGRPDLEKVLVYRPESEVFSKDAVRTLARKPVTIEHPDEEVTASNWRMHSVGYLGDDVLRDGDFIRVPLHVMDAAAVNEVKSGRSQLSVGYSAMIEWGDGVTPDGKPYQAKQTSIRANHVAITHTARGGPQLRMGDNRRDAMTTRTITVDHLPVTLEDRDAAVVERHINKLTADLTTAQTALATAQTTAQNDAATVQTTLATVKTESANKDAQIATLQKQLSDAKLTPQQLDKMVSDRVATVQRAQKIIGDSLVVEGKTDGDMRRQVVLAKLGETAKDWNDDMINASFNTLSVTDNGNFGSGNGLQHVVQVVASNEQFGGNPVGASYDQYNTDIMNRWKTAGVRNPA